MTLTEQLKAVQVAVEASRRAVGCTFALDIALSTFADIVSQAESMELKLEIKTRMLRQMEAQNIDLKAQLEEAESKTEELVLEIASLETQLEFKIHEKG